jgi:hypothetical protein
MDHIITAHFSSELANNAGLDHKQNRSPFVSTALAYDYLAS